MANEISYSLQLRCTNPSAAVAAGNFNLDRTENKTNVTQAVMNFGAIVQSVPTTAGGTVIALPGGITTGTLGYAMLTNLDTTNYVEVGVKVAATFDSLLKLKAGESQVVRFAQTNPIYAMANTGAVKLRIDFLAE